MNELDPIITIIIIILIIILFFTFIVNLLNPKGQKKTGEKNRTNVSKITGNLGQGKNNQHSNNKQKGPPKKERNDKKSSGKGKEQNEKCLPKVSSDTTKNQKSNERSEKKKNKKVPKKQRKIEQRENVNALEKQKNEASLKEGNRKDIENKTGDGCLNEDKDRTVTEIPKREENLKEDKGKKELKNAKPLKDEVKKVLNPRKSKPDNAKYVNLSISDGHLIPCELGKTPYYRAWKYENDYYYEFYCDTSKIVKAINDHSVIIDPYCIKSSDSIDIIQANNLFSTEYGKMDSNFNIINKSVIKYK